MNSYFPHDSNAKDDPKCVLLIEQLGMEGYGIYWMLIETLREQPNYRYPLNLLSALARRYNTTGEKVKAVVCSYGLFQIENDEFFFSHSLIERMRPLEERKLLASKAGKASAERRKANACSTDVQQEFNLCSTTVQPLDKIRVDNNKKKNIKEKATRFSPPTLDEVRAYCQERKNYINPERFIDFYQSKNWMIGKNKMKDWKAAVRTWEHKEEQKGGSNESTQEYIIPD